MRIHQYHAHGNLHFRFIPYSQAVGHLCFPIVKLPFEILQSFPVLLFCANSVKGTVNPSLYQGCKKKNVRSNPAEVSAGCYQDIQSLITSIKHVSVTSFDPCRLSSGSFVSKSSSWIPQGRPCHAEMYLSRTKIPHHISRRICISVEDMFRKQGVFFQTDGSLCRPRSCAWLQALICRRKSEISSQITNHSYSIADVHPTYRATSANLSICHHEKGQTAVKAALLWYLSISQTRREGEKGGNSILCCAIRASARVA